MRTIALIGHSGAGKSSCLRQIAEMDIGLDTRGGTNCPSAETALAWIARVRPVAVVGEHIPMLREMIGAKGQAESRTLSNVLFVYLRKDKERLGRHLANDAQWGSRKSAANGSVLDRYEEMDGVYSALADHTLDIGQMSLALVAGEVLRLGAQAA